MPKLTATWSPITKPKLPTDLFPKPYLERGNYPPQKTTIDMSYSLSPYILPINVSKESYLLYPPPPLATHGLLLLLKDS